MNLWAKANKLGQVNTKTNRWIQPDLAVAEFSAAGNFDLPVALGLRLAYRALKIILNEPGVGAD